MQKKYATIESIKGEEWIQIVITGYMKWLRREECIFPFSQYWFSLACRPTIASCLQGTISRAAELGPFLGSPWIQLVAAAASSCLGRLQLGAPQHSHEKAPRNKRLLFPNRWFFPDLLPPCSIYNIQAWFRALYFVARPFPLHLVLVLILPHSIKSWVGQHRKLICLREPEC